jgi:hypothetical protein
MNNPNLASILKAQILATEIAFVLRQRGLISYSAEESDVAKAVTSVLLDRRSEKIDPTETFKFRE